MDSLNPMDFDALQYTKQNFNTLENQAFSKAVQNMTQQSLDSIRTMQTPVPQGFIPEHVTPAIFQQKENPIQFFVVIDNERRGPFTRSEIEGLLSTGQIDYTTLAWVNGMNNWSSLQACLQFINR